MWKNKTYWLVGASEGLGRALAKELDSVGANLILSARSVERLSDLSQSLSRPARIIPCDVANADSVFAAWQSAGDIDGVVYLAGLYEPMTAQQWDSVSVERICDVNFIGAVRVLGCVVPSFTRRGSGHIALIGSLAGYRGLPGAIGYGASKAALMHLAETLQIDLWRTDIRVQLLNPGFIKTRLTDKNSFKMPFLLEPDRAARTARKIMEGNKLSSNFPWIFSLLFRLARFLPTGLYLRLFSKT